ncbi:type 1 glutamine amidotransferase domain-containing protein [Propionibacteriaceae bacterium Y2011]|uniref:type 1 glutamine amidotransferase domain-containing protein n=1 Tax=Microlunatus sp. Y2014 TaxID=3418488 RepID=UPI003B455F46
MTDQLRGKKVAFLMANSGVEQAELTDPWEAVRRAGGEPVLIAPERGQVQAMYHDVEAGDTFDVDLTVAEASAGDYAGLVIPGGTTNPDQLRMQSKAVGLVRAFVAERVPVAAICHGPWMLVEADVVDGKSLTSWPSLGTDIRNAGGDWQDDQVVVCGANDWTLVTSRRPDDLPQFCTTLVDEFSATPE